MEWKIGNVTIPNQLVVAPMAGVTNSAFRIICKKFGAGLVVCEMISDRGIMYNNKKTLSMVNVDPNEHPMSIQIFGGTKETLVEAAKFIDQKTAADIIDINMGCPVNKVVKTDAGAKWLLDPDKVYEMVSYVTDAVQKPVTVKMRTGWDEDHVYAIQNALAAEAAGASAVAMHGRTRKQMYTGHANWEILKEVADALTIPFIGNGDVTTPQQAKQMIDEVGCDAVMMGRAVEGNPWILKQTERYLETGELIPEPSVEEKINTAKEHLHGLVKIKGDYVGPRQFRGQAAYYLKGISHSARTKVKLNNAESEEEMDQIFDDFLEKDAKRNARKNA
ncbi:tRNA dihydrouridine synthase DusB [Fructilactobacillus fructivorans]|uniref:tRNA-dihydrouridine synthase n=1 Tax=Fructilactobacillus fructivorans TaxID=1614 RepID=A0A0C1PJX5_9LACO|nr:tRNA dihydrouridine synthase DusB [Fructilactobacillus fructivorans]KID41022.1 tRNA dihydrouridine synthase B [Fructilactobacillus fructivorans]MCT0151394.1 tRNA dihydrouridine synthase DusB [Fructilactobacillus fructivorans]MCT2866913.1 tRNA dihydrouridine synthase DusB [Fructilactobacillus fructivorans]MCT2869214.1 tRNA dihydrouridine synthase DusB [Fructilactobacillus fructivorans]MCT2873749.1 tRNA dihydrouridine synthase DusB [Fructilactobacillus fructivorans]